MTEGGVQTEKLTSHVTFQEVPLTEALIDSALPLLEAHYREIAHYQDIPLQIDRAVYLQAAAQGSVKVFLFLHEEVLQGYAVFFVRPNIHYAGSLQAVQDILYIAPRFRHQMYGAAFIRWCDLQLKEAGCQVVYHHMKDAHTYASTMKRLGYEQVETIWSRRLDG